MSLNKEIRKCSFTQFKTDLLSHPARGGGVCFFSEWHINFSGLINALIVGELKWYNLTLNKESTWVPAFYKGISPKVNVIARLDLELASYDIAVHLFSQGRAEQIRE